VLALQNPGRPAPQRSGGLTGQTADSATISIISM